MPDTKFKFEFSLSVLTHLGRKLYRNLGTVVAEAISNAWDSDATCVEITVEKDSLIIIDNGAGMSRDDVQKKFLKIGYSKRDHSRRTEKNGRHVLGRKGIGKLAYLSISKEVHIITRKQGEQVVKAKIDNDDLDKCIDKGVDAQNYSLGSSTLSEQGMSTTGTKLVFKGLESHLRRENLRSVLATHFHFTHALKGDDKFEIVVDGKKITVLDMGNLYKKSQFMWFFGDESKSAFKKEFQKSPWLKSIKEQKSVGSTFDYKNQKIKVSGYITSVEKPKDLLIPRDWLERAQGERCPVCRWPYA